MKLTHTFRAIARSFIAVFGALTLPLSAFATYTQTTFNRSFTNIFRATDTTSPLDYATLGNWWTTSDNGTNWTNFTGSLAPSITSSTTGATYTPFLVDGNLFASDTTAEKDSTTGRYNVTLADVTDKEIDGYNLRFGVANYVHLTIPKIKKLQSDGVARWIYVDETSKLTVGDLGSQGSNLNGASLYIQSPEGLTVTDVVDAGGSSPVFNYHLYTKGSVLYSGGLSSTSRTHTVSSVILDLGNNTKIGRTIVTRKLIGFTSASNQTFNYTNTGVSTISTTPATEEGGTATTVTTLAATEKTSGDVELFDNIGTYYFYQGDDGYYVKYVAYGDERVYARTVADATGDWSSANTWALFNGETNITVPEDTYDARVTTTADVDSTLTVNASSSLGTLTVRGDGTLTFAADTSTADETAASLTLTTTEVDAPLTVRGGGGLSGCSDDRERRSAHGLC